MKSNLLSTNFLIAVAVLIGSYFGIKEGVTNEAVMALVGVIGAFGMVRTALKDAKPAGAKPFLADPNTWTHIAAVISAGIPALSVLVQPLHDLSDAFLSGSWAKIITALLALGSILYYTFFNKKG